MERQHLITISPAGHPDPRVGHAGFDLEHAYVERCWAPVLGPTSTALTESRGVVGIEDVILGVFSRRVLAGRGQCRAW